MKIKIKDLSERIRIIYYLTARNEYGDLIKVREVTRCRVWARVHALAQRIDDGTPERLNKTTYRITIRWRDDIQPNDEIIWRDRYFKIISAPTEFEVRHQWKVFDAQEFISDFTAAQADTDTPIEKMTLAMFDEGGNLVKSIIKFASADDFAAMLDDDTPIDDFPAEFYKWTIGVFDNGELINSGIKLATADDFAAMLNDLDSDVTEDPEINNWTIAVFDSDGQLVDSGLKFATAEDMTAILGE